MIPAQISEVTPMDNDPTSQVMPSTTPEEAVKVLTEILPQLESECEDARRCFNIIAENFRIANSRLQTMVKAGKMDNSVHEFAYAAVELSRSLYPLLESTRQIEAATNELVKGAQALPKS